MTAFEEVSLISVGLSLLLALLYKFLVNQGEAKRVKEEMKFYREKISKAQKEGNTTEVSKMSSDMLKASQKQLRLTMKPMLASLLIFGVVLSWLGSVYVNVVFPLPFNAPFAGTDLSWFWWYVIVTVPFSIFFRKLLGVE